MFNKGTRPVENVTFTDRDEVNVDFEVYTDKELMVTLEFEKDDKDDFYELGLLDENQAKELYLFLKKYYGDSE